MMRIIFGFVLTLAFSTLQPAFSLTKEQIEKIPPGTFFCERFDWTNPTTLLMNYCRKDLPFTKMDTEVTCCTKVGASSKSEAITQLQKFTNQDLLNELQRRNSK